MLPGALPFLFVFPFSCLQFAMAGQICCDSLHLFLSVSPIYLSKTCVSQMLHGAALLACPPVAHTFSLWQDHFAMSPSTIFLDLYFPVPKGPFDPFCRKMRPRTFSLLNRMY